MPQGTVLGPILFILYVNDLILALRSSKGLSFADDTKLIQAIIGVLSKFLLQEDLEAVIRWTQLNNMELHEDKFEVLNYCLNSSLLLRNLPLVAELRQYDISDGRSIYPVDVVRDLGVILSSDCSWSPQVNNTVKEARKMASWVLSVFRDRSPFLMLTLFKSMVRSKLEYCCPVWNPSKVWDIQAIENIQRQFTRKISSCKDIGYWERLKKLDLLSLQRRRERYMIIHVWKMLNDKAPNNIGMTFYQHERHGFRANVPSYNYKAQKSVASAYDDSFGIKAARLWNILPRIVNEQKTLDSLKISLSCFLEKFPDTPPVPGYSPCNRNSLLDWCSEGILSGRRT